MENAKPVDVELLIDLVDNLPEYKSRKPRLMMSSKYENYGDFYSYVINDWIPAQPDARNLMIIFINLGFNLLSFVEIIITKNFDRTAKRLGIEL